MANAKQVLDVQVSKGITAAQGNEHLRNRSEEAEKYAMSKGNYDPTRKHRYSESQGERDILGIERPGKDRAGVILQNNTLLSHSPEEQAQTISL